MHVWHIINLILAMIGLWIWGGNANLAQQNKAWGLYAISLFFVVLTSAGVGHYFMEICKWLL